MEVIGWVSWRQFTLKQTFITTHTFSIANCGVSS